jgi:DNA-binding transcriptional LysR family regulator
VNLRHIRYFVAVAEAGSFRKASQKLHIAQPALTRQITALEKELGVPLFEAGSRRRVLGPAGKALVKEASAILANMEQVVQRIQAVGRKERAKVRIGFVDAASDDARLASFVTRLRHATPAAEIELVPMTSTQQVQALLGRRIDFGCLCCLPRMDERIALQPLADHSMIAVLQRSHPLARRKKIFLKDLEKSRLIFVSRAIRSDLHRVLAESFRKAGLAVPSMEEAESSARVASLASVGMGVGILLSAVKSRLPEGLVGRPIADLGLTYRLAIAWCQDPRDPTTARLAAMARGVENLQ